MKKVLAVVVLFLLIPKWQTAQSGNLALRGGISAPRGETSDGPFANNYGYDVSLSYILTLSSEQWMLTSELSNSSYQSQLDFNNKPVDSSYISINTQNYFGVGFRRYLTRSVTTLNPYPGQLLPYLGVNFGCVQTDIDIKQKGALPSAYKTLPETTFQMAFQFEAGLDINLTKRWCIHSYVTLRTGRTDNWDGITGRGYGTDWVIRGGLGALYRL